MKYSPAGSLCVFRCAFAPLRGKHSFIRVFVTRTARTYPADSTCHLRGAPSAHPRVGSNAARLSNPVLVFQARNSKLRNNAPSAQEREPSPSDSFADVF